MEFPFLDDRHLLGVLKDLTSKRVEDSFCARYNCGLTFSSVEKTQLPEYVASLIVPEHSCSVALTSTLFLFNGALEQA